MVTARNSAGITIQFVIQPMYVDVLRTFADVGRGYDELLKQVEHRAGRYAAELEKNINADGSYPVIGRSITYRFGAFQLAVAGGAGRFPAE